MDTIKDYRLKLKEIADYAFSYGIKSIGVEQFKSGPPESWDKNILDIFFISCHEGFKVAQKLVIEEMQKYQTLHRESTAELKEFRRQRNKLKVQQTLSKIKLIERRLHNFSHMADGIAWQLLGGQLHLSRRLYIQEKSSKFLDSSNLSHAIEVANQINLNPLDFALISDLTGFVQIGDLLVRRGMKTFIMELKEGEVNKTIHDFLDEMDKSEKEVTDEILKERFDENTVKQIKRVQRQQERANRAVEVMNNDVGKDPVTGQNIFVRTPAIQTETYHEELLELYNNLQNSCWAYTVVDTCIHIGMYRDECIAMAGFAIPQILKEETDNSMFVDWLTITENLSEPLFGKPFPPDFIIDILTGEVKVMIGINMDALINTFNIFGLKTRWMTEKETARMKQNIPQNGMIIVNKKGILITLSETVSTVLFGGIVSKIIYDNINPSNIALMLMLSEIEEENESEEAEY